MYVGIKYYMRDLICDVISLFLKLRYGQDKCVW